MLCLIEKYDGVALSILPEDDLDYDTFSPHGSPTCFTSETSTAEWKASLQESSLFLPSTSTG